MKSERLIYRKWDELDAPVLYKLAKSPDVGPRAGWPVHSDVEMSKMVINEVLSADNTFAICLAESGEPIGSCGLIVSSERLRLEANEAEVGYWLGKEYWNKGYATEALKWILNYGFNELKLKQLWATYYAENTRSKHVLEKSGFHYVRTEYNVEAPLINAVKTLHVMVLPK